MAVVLHVQYFTAPFSTLVSEVMSLKSTGVELKSYCFPSAAVSQQGTEEPWYGAKHADGSLGDLGSQFIATRD